MFSLLKSKWYIHLLNYMFIEAPPGFSYIFILLPSMLIMIFFKLMNVYIWEESVREVSVQPKIFYFPYHPCFSNHPFVYIQFHILLIWFLKFSAKCPSLFFDFLRLIKVSCYKSYDNSNHATFTLGNATLCLCLFISCHLFLHYNNVLKSLETISCWLCLNTFSSRQLLFENSTFMSKGGKWIGV